MPGSLIKHPAGQAERCWQLTGRSLITVRHLGDHGLPSVTTTEVGMDAHMSEFTSEGSQAADEEVAHISSEPIDDPLTAPGRAADSGQGPESSPADDAAYLED
jgi:hypothetical protein